MPETEASPNTIAEGATSPRSSSEAALSDSDSGLSGEEGRDTSHSPSAAGLLQQQEVQGLNLHCPPTLPGQLGTEKDKGTQAERQESADSREKVALSDAHVVVSELPIPEILAWVSHRLKDESRGLEARCQKIVAELASQLGCRKKTDGNGIPVNNMRRPSVSMAEVTGLRRQSITARRPSMSSNVSDMTQLMGGRPTSGGGLHGALPSAGGRRQSSSGLPATLGAGSPTSPRGRRQSSSGLPATFGMGLDRSAVGLVSLAELNSGGRPASAGGVGAHGVGAHRASVTSAPGVHPGATPSTLAAGVSPAAQGPGSRRSSIGAVGQSIGRQLDHFGLGRRASHFMPSFSQGPVPTSAQITAGSSQDAMNTIATDGPSRQLSAEAPAQPREEWEARAHPNSPKLKEQVSDELGVDGLPLILPSPVAGPEDTPQSLGDTKNAWSSSSRSSSQMHVLETSASSKPGENNNNNVSTLQLPDRRMSGQYSNVGSAVGSVTPSSLGGHLAARLSSQFDGKDGKNVLNIVANKTFGRRTSCIAEAINEDEPQTLSFLARTVSHPAFESTFACLILLNTLVMACEAQHSGLMLGMDIKYYEWEGVDSLEATMIASGDPWPGAVFAWKACEMFFGVMFSVELAMKLMVEKNDFFKDYWNAIDSFVVVFWLVGNLDVFEIPLPPQLIRMVRLVRLLRLLKLVRTVKGFDSLFIMTTSITGSVYILMWSVVLLLLIEMMLAMLLQNVLAEFINGDGDPAARRLVFEYFGSFARTMLTMFEITFGDWHNSCRILMEHVSEFFLLFFLTHLMILSFSVIAVINGVFISETFKVATSDDKIMLMQYERDMHVHKRKMQDLFEAADLEGRGSIDVDAFARMLDNRWVKSWLGAMQLEVASPEHLFHLIDFNGDGELDVDELVRGVKRLKGEAKSFDVVSILQACKEMQTVLKNMYDKVCPSEEFEEVHYSLGDI